MREALEGVDSGIKFGGVKVNDLRYADDTTLLCSSRQDLMNLLSQVKSASEEKGLLLYTKKTKIMVLDKNDSGADFLLDGQKIEVVKQLRISFVYGKQHFYWEVKWAIPHSTLFCPFTIFMYLHVK